MSKPLRHHLIPVEPEASQTAEHPGLYEGYPAGMKLHDNSKGAVGGQDDVVDHGGVIADPNIVGSIDWPGSVVPHNTSPRSYKHAALELHQSSLPRHAAPFILRHTPPTEVTNSTIVGFLL